MLYPIKVIIALAAPERVGYRSPAIEKASGATTESVIPVAKNPANTAGAVLIVVASRIPQAVISPALIKSDLQALLIELARQGVGMAAPELKVTTFAELFKRHVDFDLRPGTGAGEMAALCDRLGIHRAPDDSFDDLFHRVWIDRIEPLLIELGPVLVGDFPPSQAALARLNERGWAERFEFFWNGLEIANAFYEVVDADEILILGGRDMLTSHHAKHCKKDRQWTRFRHSSRTGALLVARFRRNVETQLNRIYASRIVRAPRISP